MMMMMMCSSEVYRILLHMKRLSVLHHLLLLHLITQNFFEHVCSLYYILENRNADTLTRCHHVWDYFCFFFYCSNNFVLVWRQKEEL